MAGDFNHANLKVVLPRLYQHVKYATRGDNTLDKVYTNIKGGYRAKAHLGQSDHVSLLLIPAYSPIRKSVSTIIKTIKTWPLDATPQLQDCFENTDWVFFEHEDLEQYTSAVLGYIKHCSDSVTVDKRIRVHPNKKPWMTGDVQHLVRERDIAFRTGERKLYSTARTDLKRGIKRAKMDYKGKIEDCFRVNDSRRVWQGVQLQTQPPLGRRG
ncbi:uncharacterized protein LOC117552071 [Gymnodraco acuticeps]|uniref:Uncharacterized protein LOC117552071 n=1 Tax=Gymnodraco acuticeps TaxID=8218 RepID=A0A6P8V047_GYMAC|nr:uncharacterized protein LOC117552071 [Gymnodraco acuticeps]